MEIVNTTFFVFLLTLVFFNNHKVSGSKISQPEFQDTERLASFESNHYTKSKKFSAQMRNENIASPFYFLCHLPNRGGLSDTEIKDIRIKINSSGKLQLDQGYEPLTVYHLTVDLNVQVDGFLLTGVHKITKAILNSPLHHIPPPSPQNVNSAGNICTFLNSHISKRPKRTINLTWMAPPSETGCVSFLATGSLQEKILFKDLLAMEICEKEQNKRGHLNETESFSQHYRGELIFKDDFQQEINRKIIWDEVVNGTIKNQLRSTGSERAIHFQGNPSFIYTKPLNFSEAKQLQYTLIQEHCKNKGNIKVSIGTTRELNNPAYSEVFTKISDISFDENHIENSTPYSTTGSAGNEEYLGLKTFGEKDTEYEKGSYSNINEVNLKEKLSGINFLNISKDIYGQTLHKGSRNLKYFNETNDLKDVESTEKTHCTQWHELDVHGISDIYEVYTRDIPSRFKDENICIKFELSDAVPKNSSEISNENPKKSENDDDNDYCWTLDNVAVMKKQSRESPLIEDFDPINPVNWLFFPGGQVKEACGSEGNSLFFDGLSDVNWASTRQIDLSVSDLRETYMHRSTFATSEDHSGWYEIGASFDVCSSDEGKFTFYSSGTRTLCSPFIDGRIYGVVRIVGGISKCSLGESATIQMHAESKNEKEEINKIHFHQNYDVIVFPLTSLLQRDGTRLCLEQHVEAEAKDAWYIKEITFLPWMPSEPHHFIQVQLNLNCGYHESEIDIEGNNDGENWWSLHSRCISGMCEGKLPPLVLSTFNERHSGWKLITLPLPYIALTSNARIRIRQREMEVSKWRAQWAFDYIYIGRCPNGCNSHGLCIAEGKCKCEYGYAGRACELPVVNNPLYIQEPFMENFENSANILETSGGESGFQCGVIGSGKAAVFNGQKVRHLITVDMNTTHAHILEFNFRSGATSEIGKCPGTNTRRENIYVYYSCSGGTTWHLLHEIEATKYREPSRITIWLPPGARNISCRFQLWQPEHSGSGHSVWAVDDLTISSQRTNTIQLTFDHLSNTNDSLRFYHGDVGPYCGRNNSLKFTELKGNGIPRFLETKSIQVGPSYMMQFDLVIGCSSISSTFFDDNNTTIVLEYSCNHGLTWNVVHLPCSPAVRGCESHFTRGTIYYISEFINWKRVTLQLPKHTWSLNTRLRLRESRTNERSLTWAVDNIYIGPQCEGLCSGHGYCTAKGCRCDHGFRSNKCLPLDKLHSDIFTDFSDKKDISSYGFQVIGGSLVSQFEGCGVVASGQNLYFGSREIRHFETDEIRIDRLESVSFYIVIGGDHGVQRACQSPESISASEDEVSKGSVVLEYSLDGGVSWNLLREMIQSEFRIPKLLYQKFDDTLLTKAKATSGVIRLRIWQPKHGIENQWAIDDFTVKGTTLFRSLQATFNEFSAVQSPWKYASSFSVMKYCGGTDSAQVMDSTDPVRSAITPMLELNETAVISFQISVGCNRDRDKALPVYLEYTRDSGITWNLVKEGCQPHTMHCRSVEEPSIFLPTYHKEWQRVTIPLDHKFSHRDIQFRFKQRNPLKNKGGEFALKNLYIGNPCKYNCMGHGICNALGLCSCDKNYSGKYCGKRVESNPSWLKDDFETDYLTSDSWEYSTGKMANSGCDPDHISRVMFFSDEKLREIVTREIDARNVQYLVFELQIGANHYESRCQKGKSPRDDVWIHFSTDNSLSWKELLIVTPIQTVNRSQPFFIPIPKEARTRQTKFKWSQIPQSMLQFNEEPQSEWHLDDVMILANRTLPNNLEDDFTNSSEVWFMVRGGERTNKCSADVKNNALYFSGHVASRFAETWDFEVNEATILQFDLNPSCRKQKSAITINVEFSINLGKSWNLIKPSWNEMHRAQDLPSSYSSKAILNWTRISLVFPSETIGEKTRIRFRQTSQNGKAADPFSIWALDNLYVGDSCPWMCSGHGRCYEQKCQCDEGFFGEYCVPASVLPCDFLDTFDDEIKENIKWNAIQGAEISKKCGVISSKTSLVFFKEGHRYATTPDLDMTNGHFIQFSLAMGCQGSSNLYGKSQNPSRKYRKKYINTKSIMVQYSIDGGITWDNMKNIEYEQQNKVLFISIHLSDFEKVRSNATRFRLLQAQDIHNSMENIWVIDNFYIGGSPNIPSNLYDDFNAGHPSNDAFIDWPGGMVHPMCSEVDDSRSALVFDTDEGEHALYTKDLTVIRNSVMQFDIKVGCENITKREHNVSLEFSTDFGQSWSILRSISFNNNERADSKFNLQAPSIFYPNAGRSWIRNIIPLRGLSFCGYIRFRWRQGYYFSKEVSEPWGIDNIFIGTSCENDCMGHGVCLPWSFCNCDEEFEIGSDCRSSSPKSQGIKEKFENDNLTTNFLKWSGGHITEQCDLLSGRSFFFSCQGERMLITKDLDLTHGSVIQFYIRFSCFDDLHTLNESFPTENILLQFSVNGGVKWLSIQTLLPSYSEGSYIPEMKYFTILLPEKAKTNSTRIRWWQPSIDGHFAMHWAIDEIFVGNVAESLHHFYDNGSGINWLLSPGSQVGRPCGIQQNGLHFTKNSRTRFAETPDIIMNTNTFIQFEISLGCGEAKHCFDIELEYSIDYGKSWSLVQKNCLPSDAECLDYHESSLFTSDVYSFLKLVTLILPERVRWKLARFRFKQHSPWESHYKWFLSRVYVGSECSSKCSGRGICLSLGKCNCQEGWTGKECKDSIIQLPSFVADDFENSSNLNKNWANVVGGDVSETCGPVASKYALHFYGSCSRVLETKDLDLRDGLFIQFNYMPNCLHQSNIEDSLKKSGVMVQITCNAGINWKTLKILNFDHVMPKYYWIELPKKLRCLGARIRWWQPAEHFRSNSLDWALDDVFIGGNTASSDSVSLVSNEDLSYPIFNKFHNFISGHYCGWQPLVTLPVFASTPSEAAMVQTSDLKITTESSIYFRLALGCSALWDNDIEPVRLEYSVDFGEKWQLVRELCLPVNSSCSEFHDESVFYAPQNWQYYVFPLHNIPPSRFARFRWIQKDTTNVMASHTWSLTDVYIGPSCLWHCLGRGVCNKRKCFCTKEFSGTYCQDVIANNAAYIRDTFKEGLFLKHWQHVQGALVGRGCDDNMEEPPVATFQGSHSRTLVTKPLDTRNSRFVLFTAQIGSIQGRNNCRRPHARLHNIYLQYSNDGGIRWQLLREIDHNIYHEAREDYILIPKEAMTSATLFRFWQPRLNIVPPAWSLDNIFIGGSEIGADHLLESFENEPTVSEWLFAPHSEVRSNYCGQGDNGSLVWDVSRPGRRSITTQELLVQRGHVVQFKISVGCQQLGRQCSNKHSVRLEYTKDGGASDWELVEQECFPESSPDPDCYPYIFHGSSTFSSDSYSNWTRITLELPEKTWSSTTQLRWIQTASHDYQIKQIPPWALDDVYIGIACPENCRGRGKCIEGVCHCDQGYAGLNCLPKSLNHRFLPISLIEGFEGGLLSNWATVTGGNIGLGCNSLAPYGHGKHLYFNGCGIRQAITLDLDLTFASKVMYVLRIGSHDDTKSCRINLNTIRRAGNKGVIFQFSTDNGIVWSTIDVHSPFNYKKARRVAYSIPQNARQRSVKLRWWQPEHDGFGIDQWALDNVEVVLGQKKMTHRYEPFLHRSEEEYL